MKPTQRYDLTKDKIGQLCQEFLVQNPQMHDSRFSCFWIDGRDKFSDLGRYVEGEAFKETFNNGPARMTKEYGPYEDFSIICTVIDRQSHS
jgi:hypothetical protein